MTLKHLQRWDKQDHYTRLNKRVLNKKCRRSRTMFIMSCLRPIIKSFWDSVQTSCKIICFLIPRECANEMFALSIILNSFFFEKKHLQLSIILNSFFRELRGI